MLPRTLHPPGPNDSLGYWGRGAEQCDGDMARRPDSLRSGSTVVVTNPDEDCSPKAFRALLHELLASPEPELDSIEAAEALHGLRVDAGA